MRLNRRVHCLVVFVLCIAVAGVAPTVPSPALACESATSLVHISDVATHRHYKTGWAEIGALPYVDRPYKISQITPGLAGGVLVRTANNDKRNKEQIHLRLYMHEPATLYVAYDKRGASKPPQWLSDWSATDLTIRTSDRRASPMVVFERSVDKDQIVELGGNRYKGGYKAWSNYFVVAVPDEPWKRNALLVVGKSRLNFSDALVKSRLEARGFRVTVKDDDEVIASDADGKDIVLLSESVYSKRVGDIFTQVSVPVICWEPYLFDDLGITGSAAGIDFGYVRKQREINFVDPEHPMAGKKQGAIPVTHYPARFGWGLPDASAQVVATLVDDPGKATVFYYDAETDMPGGFPAPARRIGLFFDKHTPKKLNTDGRWLLEAAFDAALGVNSLKVLSDDSWKSIDQEYEDWETPGFDDSGWNAAVSPYPNRKPAHHWFRMPGTNAQYMWDFPPGSGEMNGRNGPEDAWFRKTFELPAEKSEVTSAAVTMAVDDVFDFYVNGKLVFSNWDNAGHSGPVTFNILDYLQEGTNLMAIYASDAYRGYEWALFEATIEWVPADIPDPVWTVMVYLNGDNQNDADMVEDLQEMEHGLFEAMKNDPDVIHKLALVVQYDGAGRNNTIRYRVQPDPDSTGDIVSEIIYNEPGEPNMGDPATLKDFITDTMEVYPDTYHALVLGNHGNAVASSPVAGYTSSPAKYILWDQTNGNDRLYVAEVTDNDADGLTESESVDLLGLDTGFMGTVETAYQFRPDSGKFGANFIQRTVKPGLFRAGI